MEDTTSPKAILERLKQGTFSKTDKDLAEKLGVAQQSVYNVNAKNRVPEGWVRKIAIQYNLSTDWLFFGVGDMRREPEKLPNGVTQPSVETTQQLEMMQDKMAVIENALQSPGLVGRDVSSAQSCNKCTELYAKLEQANERLYQAGERERVLLKEVAELKEENLLLKNKALTYQPIQTA